jgi:hypothetical protein
VSALALPKTSRTENNTLHSGGYTPLVIQRIDDAAVQSDDDPLLAAHVSGRARIAGGVCGLHPHAIADVKAVRGLGHAHLGTWRSF